MHAPRQIEYLHAPSAFAFMARAILAPRRPGLGARPAELRAAWRGHRVQGVRLETFLALTGLAGHPTWPLLYPHAVAFRLQMAVLTQRAFPLPIWNALQVRNHVVQHALYDAGATLDFATRVSAQRIVEKGIEIDLHTTAHIEDRLVWSSTNVFYYRGAFGAAQANAPPAPRLADGDALRWTAPEGGAVRSGWLTGDYNGIHLFDAYARRFGFRGAFQHPQRVLGECLARLPRPMAALPLQLEVWLKGPVYYGAEVVLRFTDSRDALCFVLNVADDARPAIVGRISATPAPGYTRRPE